MMRFIFQIIFKISTLWVILFFLTSVLLVSCRNDSFPKEPQQWKYARDYPKAAWKEVYPLCETGGFQVPIDINSNDVNVVSLPTLKIKLLSHAVWLVNNSYSAEVIFKQEKNTLAVNNETYILQEFHFHTPGENMIDNQRYPMELHWVYYANGKWVVIAVLFQAGTENQTLTQLLKYLPQVQGKLDISTMVVDFNALLPGDLSTYYRFEGSLTTPPCSRHITWYLLKQPVMASTSQINRLKERFGDNARPIQPLNQRLIESSAIRSMLLT